MRNLGKIAVILVLFILANIGVSAQDDRPGSEVPSGIISTLVVSDPKSPLQITGPFRVLGYSYGGFDFGYTLQNKSNLDLESFEIRESDWFSAHGYENSYDVKKGQRFSPGMTRYSFSDDALNDLIPYDQNRGLQSQLDSRRNRLWIVMVVKVKLADGTVYDATQKFEQLEKFLSELDGTSKAEDKLNQRETRVRDFVSKLLH